jgi:broad specificity phosphatase PhoE
MPHLYVVRHAEPAITGVLLGQSDPPLSESGRGQAAELLRGTRLEIAYTSPLRRARETAEFVARGAPIEIVDDLREITYGDWDGRTWAEIEAKDPEITRRKLEDWRGVTPPGGESWDEFEARVLRAFERIKCGPRPAAVVAHAAVNRVIAGVELGYGEVHEL